MKAKRLISMLIAGMLTIGMFAVAYAAATGRYPNTRLSTI